MFPLENVCAERAWSGHPHDRNSPRAERPARWAAEPCPLRRPSSPSPYYLRDYASGHAQEILRVYDDPQFSDLAQWRSQQGISPQPDIAVISASLDFPIPEALLAGGRRVVIFTVEQADPRRVRELEAHAGQVVMAGETKVSGDRLVQAMAALGYRAIYSASGPKVLHLLLAAGVLDRLYLTLANRLVGGDPFSSIVEGPLLAPAVGMRLDTAYHDAQGLDGLGQLFLSYRRAG